MNRRVVSGTIAALAAVVLAAGSTTLGAFDDQSEIPANRTGAGVLQLDLGGGTGHAALTFAGLEPGDKAIRRLWIVANDSTSTTAGTVEMAVGAPNDVPGPCDTSLGKAQGDIASGIAGCVITARGVHGTPAYGVASRLIAVDISVAAASDVAGCAGATPGASVLPRSGPGNLAHYGRTKAAVTLRDAHARPMVLAPGRGVCVVVDASWPPSVTDAAHATPDHPVDNAAQGDSMSVDVRFTLTQAAP